MRKIIYLILALTMGCASQKNDNDSLEHHIGEFGDSMETIRKNLEGRYSKLEERELSLILSTAKKKLLKV